MTEAQPQSIADRIAALKLNQVGRVPGENQPVKDQTATARRPPPPPPPPVQKPNLPARPVRTQSSNVPTLDDHATISNGGINNMPEARPQNGMTAVESQTARPTLPPRTSTQSSQRCSPALAQNGPSARPALPQRRPSEVPSTDSRRPSDFSLSRRESNESASSVATGRSGVSNGTSTTSLSERYAIKAPAYDASSLPALPPKRTKEQQELDHKRFNAVTAGGRMLKSTKSSPSVPQIQTGTTPPPPALPRMAQVPTLPSRNGMSNQEPRQIEPPPRPQREVAPPPPRKSALSMGLSSSASSTPSVKGKRPDSVPRFDEHIDPPPIPTSSRPDLTALQASKPSPSTTITAPPASVPPDTCLICRDYSGPDNHAARFPRESLPSQDLGWLANQLTAPFPSHTDKARAIFTWLHHNIAYDVVAFFGNTVGKSTPQSTFTTGLAVCEGYAGLFAALAMKVGLEAIVVSGHGKGYGHSALKAGDPLPAYKAGHAWNAVKIDGGHWKLIDCCWGAGTVSGRGQPYTKGFAPKRFTQSNDDFGNDHFPGDSSKQFRNDGRVVSWEDYILGNKSGCGAFFYSGYVDEEGLSSTTFQPTSGKIQLSQLPGPTIRFSFQKACPHWDPIRCGKGPHYLYVLHLQGLDGTQRNHIPFQTNGDVWWCDVPTRDLGRPGMQASICPVTEFDGGSGRGLTAQRYMEKKGRVAMMFGGMCMWDIA